MKNSDADVERRFWKYVVKGGPNDCWLWIGARTVGYGVLHIGGNLTYATSSRYAHRLSWLMHFGNIPTGVQICHRCDTRACVNPSHLFAGSPADNSHDMVLKERTRSSLNGSEVKKFRQLYLSGNYPPDKIAKMFGVSSDVVRKAVQASTWKLIPCPPNFAEAYEAARKKYATCQQRKAARGSQAVAKLSIVKAEKIRNLYRTGYTMRELGSRFGVSESAICRCVNGETWNTDYAQKLEGINA